MRSRTLLNMYRINGVWVYRADEWRRMNEEYKRREEEYALFRKKKDTQFRVILIVMAAFTVSVAAGTFTWAYMEHQRDKQSSLFWNGY